MILCKDDYHSVYQQIYMFFKGNCKQVKGVFIIYGRNLFSKKKNSKLKQIPYFGSENPFWRPKGKFGEILPPKNVFNLLIFLHVLGRFKNV